MLPKETEKSQLYKLLCDHSLILSYIHSKLEILNYLVEGYNTNQPVLMNSRYFIFESHIIYRSLIIDFCALYCSGRSDKRSFHQLSKFYSDVPSNLRIEIESLLDEYNNGKNPIMTLKKLRDSQIAHYDLEEIETLSFNHDHLELFNTLFKKGTELVNKIGKYFSHSIGFDFTMLSKLEFLKRLIAEIVENRTSNKDNNLH